MINLRAQIRESIIPDSSVKLMALCLSEEENEIFMPATRRKSRELEYRGDWALQEIISERIARDKARTNRDKIEKLVNNGPTPIVLRKLLLYKQARAG